MNEYDKVPLRQKTYMYANDVHLRHPLPLMAMAMLKSSRDRHYSVDPSSVKTSHSPLSVTLFVKTSTPKSPFIIHTWSANRGPIVCC